MRRPGRSRTMTGLLAVAILLGVVVTTGVVSAPAAVAAATDLTAPVRAPNTTTYEQTFTRSDATVTAGYAVGGSLTQNPMPTQALPQRNSAAVAFSPPAVGTATVAQLNYAPKVACGANRAAGVVTDCGVAGSLTVSFTAPVANPTVHVVGLGEQRGAAAHAAYLRVRSAVTTDGSNTVRFGAVQSGSGLSVAANGSQLNTTATRPDPQCALTAATVSNGPAGCGSVGLLGTTITSITFDVGVRTANADGAAGITPADVDTFDLSISLPDAAPAGAALSCADTTAYSLGGTTRDLFRVDTTTGVQTLAGGFATARAGSVNALALTPAGRAAYAVEAAVTAGGPTRVLRYDALTGARTVYPGPTLDRTTVDGSIIFGAIDPVSRNYYFGLNSAAGVELYGFDVDTNTPVPGRVALVSGISRLANGDMAFDSDGRLYIAATSGNGSATANPLYLVPGAFPSGGDDARIAAVRLAYLGPNNAKFTSAAFSGGYLYGGGLGPGNAGFITQLDPSNGAVLATRALRYQGVTDTDVSDMGSCQTPNPLRARAAIVNRVDGDDEFRLTVSSTTPAASASAVTSGGATGLRDAPAETAGPLLAIAARTYTATQTAGNATTSPEDYATSYACTRNDDATVVSSGTGRRAVFTYPTPPDNEGIGITCVFTNTAYTLSLTKTAPAVLTAGQDATYALAVTNPGPAAASGATVVDELAPGLELVSTAGEGWRCAADGRRLTCTRTGVIAAGATDRGLLLTVRPTGATVGTAITNRAAVDPTGRAAPPDPDRCTADDVPAGCAVSAAVTVADVVEAVDDAAATAPGRAVSTDVRANDSTASGRRPAEPTVVDGPGEGTATVVDGAIVYTPRTGFAGRDTYRYRVCSPLTATVCATASVTVDVVSVVEAADDAAAVAGNVAVTTPVLANDTVSPDGPALDPASVEVVTAPSGGSARANADGTITYTPAPGFAGTDTYRYRVCDSAAAPTCAQADVRITVGANVVVAADDAATTDPATATTIAVLANDSSSTGQALGAPELLSPPQRGTATVSGDGVVYTPDAGTSGLDTFTYRVCDTSNPTPVCSAPATVRVSVPNPVTAVPDLVTTLQNTVVRVDVLGNDTVSPGGAPLDPASVTVTDGPGRGTARVTDGAIRYVPAPGTSGPDTLTYRVCDTSTPEPTCASTTLAVEVTGNTVTTSPEPATTTPGVPVVVGLGGVSASGQGLAAPTVTTAPARGTVTPNPDGTLTYIPDDGFSGVDTVGYELCDTSTPEPVCTSGVATIRVVNEVTAVDDAVGTPQNTAVGTDVAANDRTSPAGAGLDPTSVTVTRAPEHGSAVARAGGIVVYTPERGYTGADTYAYTVCDLSVPEPVCSAPATVAVTVGANTVTAVDDRGATTADTPLTLTVTANDISASGQELADPAVATAPTGGDVTVEADGRLTYTPRPGFRGPDEFTYRVCDTSTPEPVCATATVTITVVNPVTAARDRAVVAPGAAVTIRVLDNDTVLPGSAGLDPASVRVGPPPTNGAAVVNPDGTITYTPAAGYRGEDTFTYRVCDLAAPTPRCDSAEVVVTAEAGIALAADDAATTEPVTGVTIDVRSNDTTSTDSALGPPKLLEPPRFGTASTQADGTVRYVPDEGFSGVDTFTYRVCDTVETALCSDATVTVTVINAVTAVPDAYTTPLDTPIILDVTANDTVTPGGAPLDPASVTVLEAPSSGTVDVPAPARAPAADGALRAAAADGALTYRPADGFTGVDVFAYRVCDTSTPVPLCDDTLVTITVSDAEVVAPPPGPVPPGPVTPSPVPPSPAPPDPAPPAPGPLNPVPPITVPPTTGPPVIDLPPPTATPPPVTLSPVPSAPLPSAPLPEAPRPGGVDLLNPLGAPVGGGTDNAGTDTSRATDRPTGPLALTGTAVLGLAALGTGTLAIGVTLVLLGRRRR